MNPALLSLLTPLATAILMLLCRSRAAVWTIAASLLSLVAAIAALYQVTTDGSQLIHLGGWESPLAIRFRVTALSALLLAFTALIHLLVGLYAARSRHSQTRNTDYWPLSCFLHASLASLWLSTDLFNWYVILELLGLTAVALVSLAGTKAHRAAFNYLLLSLAASLCYLLGVALLYGRYGVLDSLLLADMLEADHTTRTALLVITLGLMLKAALWPLHLWLPPAHAGAPTAVSALLSALVVKGPLFVLWMLWSQVAPVELGRQAGPAMAAAGVAALVSAGWSACRTPHIKTLVAYSTVAQLGYALLALGMLLRWGVRELHVALWLFVFAHGLAKASMFLAAGEMQSTLGSKKVSALRGATQTVPVAMFAFAVAGGSLIGLPPSGGFLAKWVLLQPLLLEPSHWPWALGVLLGTLASAAYVFRVIALSFDRAPPPRPDYNPDPVAQWLTLLPALLVWGMALGGETLILWMSGVAY